MKIKDLKMIESPYNDDLLNPEIVFGRMHDKDLNRGSYGNIIMTLKPHGTKDFKIAEWNYKGGLTIYINNRPVGYSAFSKRPWRLYYKFSASQAILGQKAQCRSFKTFESLVETIRKEINWKEENHG